MLFIIIISVICVMQILLASRVDTYISVWRKTNDR